MSKIKFHPFFVIYVFVCLYLGWLNAIFFYVVSVVLHEYGHYFTARLLGYESQGIVFNVYGAALKTNNVYKRKDDMLISLAGPFVNLILIILVVCFWWILPSTYAFTYDFFISNLVVMLFNLIPIYPLDGGRVIVSLLQNKFKKNKIIKVSNVIARVFSGVIFALFVVSIFYNININLLFISLFLTISTLYSDKNSIYEKTKAITKNNSRLCEVKIYKVENFDKKTMLRYLSPNYYCIFVCIKDKKKISITEDELFL